MIRHSQPTLGVEEARAAREAIERNYPGYGPAAAALEECFRQRTGRRYAFGVSSGFHAVSLALRVLDLPPGSRIGLPVLTCGSLPAAIRGAGHQPWLADIKDDDLTIDAETVGAVAAVIAPHAYGAPMDARRIAQLGVPWIEDCATSPATTIEGRPAGSFGAMAVFSFGSTKYITGGAGGMLLLDDEDLAGKVDELLAEDSEVRHRGWLHEMPPEFPGRLPDLNAAVATVQMQRLDEFVGRRRALAAQYRDLLAGADSLQLPPRAPGHSFYRYIVRTAGPARELAEALRERGVDARWAVNPWLDQQFSDAGGPWPVAAGWRDRLLSLPIYPALTDAQARTVATVLRELTSHAYAG